MFEQFMQMGLPAAVAIVGIAMSMGAIFISNSIRHQHERDERRKYELARIELSSKTKLVEHKQ